MKYILVFALLLVLELIYFELADRFNIIDRPNERSSHTSITLRGGGVVFFFGAIAFYLISGFEYSYFFIGLSSIALISFLDDIFTLSNKIRLSIQFISVLLMLYQIDILSYPLIWGGIAVIFSIGIINAYNFMDGINGITVSYSTSVLLLLLITNNYIPFINEDLIIFVLIANFVFGIFNFRQKAKCFAGDVGSVAIAFIIVFIISKLVITTLNPIFILFLLVYGLDTIWTIIQRLSKKENIFEAHRSHLYQIYANENKSDKLVVSMVYSVIQLLVGGLIVYSVLFYDRLSQYILGVVLIIVGSILYLQLKHNLIKKYKL